MFSSFLLIKYLEERIDLWVHTFSLCMWLVKMQVHTNMVFHASGLVVMAMHSALWSYYQEKHEGLCYH